MHFQKYPLFDARIMWFRYVDDTLALFNVRKSASQFLQYLMQQAQQQHKIHY